MKSTFLLPDTGYEAADLDVFEPIDLEQTNAAFQSACDTPLSQAAKKAYFKFYKVLKDDTTVTAVFTNDFKAFELTHDKIKVACAQHAAKYPAFSIITDSTFYCGFLSQIKAMEYAKAGALKYIAKLIDAGEPGYDLLLKYREDHYDDLNFNLTDKHIRQLEIAAGIYFR